MALNDLLVNIRSRIPWQIMANILRANELPSGKGWDKTIERLIAFSELSPDNLKKISVLEDIYFDHLLAGEKAVRIFEIKPEHIENLRENISQVSPAESIFRQYFPFLIPEYLLDEVESNVPYLVDANFDNSVITLVFCTKRFTTEKNELDLSQLGEEAQNDLKGYDEIIAVKHTMRQYFDVVLVHLDEGIAEIRVDISNNVSTDDQGVAFKQIRRASNELLKSFCADDPPIKEAVNLYPAIYRMYSNDEEGRVCELAFITDEASIKHEKMRKRDTDLRGETYHQAGRSAVPHITAYRLGICWSYKVGEEFITKPELLFPGNFRLLSLETPFLESALIRRCCGSQDYSFVIGKLKEYLNEPSQNA